MKDKRGSEPAEPFGPPEWSEQVEEQHEQPEAPVEDAPAPEPEVVDRSTDPAYIRVETPEYVAGSTLGQATAGFNIATGHVLVTYRLRKLPEEAELDHVKGEPHYPVPIQEPKSGPTQGRERDSDWRPGVDPQLLRHFLKSQGDDTPQRPDSTAALRWIGGGFAR